MSYSISAILHKDVLILFILKPMIEIYNVGMSKRLMDFYLVDKLSLKK